MDGDKLKRAKGKVNLRSEKAREKSTMESCDDANAKLLSQDGPDYTEAGLLACKHT